MHLVSSPPPGRPTVPPTWERFRAAVRRVDRDSLLIQAAAASAAIAKDQLPPESASLGLTPWNIADVARTSLAWASFQRPEANGQTLLQLSNMNAQLVDEGLLISEGSIDPLGQILSRTFFEQFPGQRSILAGVSRSILLFGSAAELPPDFAPEAMNSGWFEAITGGLSLEEYVESVFLVSVGAQQSEGKFSLNWLDGSAFQGLEDVFSFEAIRRTFSEHLLTDPTSFKEANRRFQDPLPNGQKKFAFNPLSDKPFISGIGDVALAPWVQAIIAKALPPAIYHVGLRSLGVEFTHDLGHVFQHYVGRQLNLVEGDRQVIPEVPYGPKRDLRDSCDWFLDLPGLLVLIECKARQPIESLRTGGIDWLQSVEGSIGKGISQLNRSHLDIATIAASSGSLDAKKRQVGIVVTLEPFYLNQNWLIRDELVAADFPVGVLSVGELEALVMLGSEPLEKMLCAAADASRDNVMLLAQDPAAGHENPLLVDTWNSISLFARIEQATERLHAAEGDPSIAATTSDATN